MSKKSKVVAFNGSPRNNGNTQAMIEKVFEPLREQGVECKRIDIAKEPLRGCIACNACKTTGVCVLKDNLNGWLEEALDADAIIVGSPTYFANVNAETKAFLDRMGRLARKDFRFAKKPFAAVVAQRKAGAVPTFDAINHMAMINQMLIVGSTYWNLGFGMAEGEVTKDDEGMSNMKNLGENLLWLMKKLNSYYPE